MKAITSKKELNAVQKKVYVLMSKGEKNLTEEEDQEIVALGLAGQEYEKKLY
jgi:hypothetical protein